MKQLTAIFALIGHLSMAQLPSEQKSTPFDKFILKPEIEWAAYVNDTIRFENPNLNKLLLLRLSKNQVKASLPVGYGSDEASRIKYQSLKEIDQIKFGKMMVPEYDSNGNLIRTLTVSAKHIDTAAFTLTQLIQVLYLEKGQLHSYVPWVSPMIPVYTSTGILLGNGNYFSSCFNYNYNYRPAKENKNTWLMKTSRKLRVDSLDDRSKLKELYGRNLVLSLWPYIINGKIGIREYATKRKLSPKDINTDLVNLEKIVVPVYDLNGNVTGEQYVINDLYPSDFTLVELVQDWFYDQAKNIVYSTINEVILFARKRGPRGDDGEASPILRLVFK